MKFLVLGKGKTGALVAEIARERGHDVRAIGSAENADGAALSTVAIELAKDVARGAEGATKLIEVAVTGAPTLELARAVAREIAASPLVKTAFFGKDPNWGRIVSAAGP